MSEIQMCPECREKQEEFECAARKAELLVHYAYKKPRLFHQWDGCLGGDIDCDSDGDSVWPCTRWELRSGMDVRVQILDGTKKVDAVRVLKKLLLEIETGKFGLVEGATPTVKESQDLLHKVEDALQTTRNAIDENEAFSAMASAQACKQLLATTIDVVAIELGGKNLLI